MKTMVLLICLLPPVLARADQARQIAIALALAAEQPAEQSITRHTPNCTWLPKKPNPASSPSNPASTEPPSPASDLANNASPQKKVASQVKPLEWTSWAKAEKSGRLKCYFFTVPTCQHCPEMLRRLESLGNELQGMDVVKMGAAEAQMFHVPYPTVLLVEGRNIRAKFEGLKPAKEVAAGIKKLKEKTQADKGSYYPAKTHFRWTLNGKNIDANHLISHWKHAQDGIDHDYIRGLDWYECNTLHDDAHFHNIDWRYAVHK